MFQLSPKLSKLQTIFHFFLNIITVKNILFLFNLGCGGIFTGHKGAFASPPPSITGACLYTISSDKPDQVIELSFPALKIKSTTDCKNEYIQIFHGITDNGTTPDKVCSLFTSPKPVVISDQRSMTLKFYSSNRTAPSEFTGEWKSIAKTAGMKVVGQ